MPMIETRDGTRLYAKSWGEGPPVILIHGWPLSGDSWDPVSHALAEAGFRAIAYDRRGFGRSDQPSGGYDYDTFADDLADVMTAMNANEGATLVGFSMGGGEIARYLSRQGGQGVSRVALVSSVVPYMLKTEDNPDGVPQSTFDEMTDGMLSDRAKFFTGFFKDFFGVGMLTQPVSDEVLHLAWITAMQAGLRPTLAAANAFATTDFRPDLASFRVPTLIIHGTSDKTVPIDATGRALARAVPHATLLEYDGEPHGVFATQTDRLIRDLLDFVSGRAADDVPQQVVDTLTAQALVTPTM
ncbi:alpha/beta hydrolase [Novosphingobium sp. MMS21-SN21R]|uniref:alpha/beta fold hydrolase n=1 Tax=Novosphingobium sp. MMS21-SN21R TaxID=2969298 RepID=UPI0028856E58|nr:alpha/beta hydrolase [Novosphingobium sp. MMS21-SN21R]MDT0507974.1 alpha/beta hydrolase [Novosphingobium sp. MMS21-SN21R]